MKGEEGEEGKGEKEGKSLRGVRTGTPLRWPPTESSCSWRVYPHHYILAPSHAARHSRIMSCFKKKRERERENYSSFLSCSFILLSSFKCVCGHVEPCCKRTHADKTCSNNVTQIISVIHYTGTYRAAVSYGCSGHRSDLINKGFRPRYGEREKTMVGAWSDEDKNN